MGAEPAPRSPVRWQGHKAEFWRDAWGAGAVHLYDSVGSTNDIAQSLAAARAPNFTVIVAEQQTHGRGRAGSAWTAAPATSLLFSVLFRTTATGDAPGCAPLRIGLAVAAQIAEARVKWPNDVVIPGHGKVAGILCEGVFGSHIVAGVGINVSQGREDFPAELRGKACSIYSATGLHPDRGALITAVLRSMREYADRITEALGAEEIAAFARADLLYRQRIACDLGDGRAVTGVAKGVAPDGALLIATAHGVKRVYNGSVRLADDCAYPGTPGMT